MFGRLLESRSFARLVRKRPSLSVSLSKEVSESGASSTSQTKEPPKEAKPEDSKPSIEWMAKRHLSPIPLPKALLKSAFSVFSKHSHNAIRDYGEKLSKAYSILHSTERPRNIEHLQPFATTTEALEEKVNTHQKTYFSPELKDFMKLETSSLAGPKKVEDEKQLVASIKYEKQHALGYLYKRLPHSYAAAYRVLSEVQVRLPIFQPTKVLDYGAGLGSGMWAAHSLFPSLKVIAGVEPADVMKDLGATLSKPVGKMKWFDNIANLPTSASEAGRFDLVLLNYVLGEIESSKMRALIVEALWHRTTNLFVIIESGTPKGFRMIHSVRDWAMKKFTREECNIVAPCPHEGNCPLAKAKSSWCHFSVFSAAYPKDIIGTRPGQFNYQNEKFSFLVLKKGVTPRQVYSTSEQAKTLDEQSFFWDRLILPVLKPTRQTIVDVCPNHLKALPLDQTGEIQRIRTSKRRNPEAHKFARKAHWGDLWPFLDSPKSR